MGPGEWVAIGGIVVGVVGSAAKFMWSYVNHKTKNLWQALEGQRETLRVLDRDMAVERARREHMEAALLEIRDALRDLRKKA